MTKRCDWVGRGEDYIAYHDNEWGRPQHDSQKLFAKLCLESQQAGLSWITVLRKRDEYRRCFFDFNPQKIATMCEADIERLLQNTGLIRNRRKLQSIVTNAKAYLAMQQAGEDFAEFVWSFVGGKQQRHQFKTIEEVPASSAESKAMSKALKKRGFVFVGETTCYAFMQSMGLVNDHLIDCCCYQACCEV